MADILFIDGCMRGWEVSRTYAAAEKFLEAYQRAHPEDTVEVLHLTEIAYQWHGAKEVERTARLLADGQYQAPEFAMARRFAQADKILLAAPYWNMGLPAAVIAYLENVCVGGLTFLYEDDGTMRGLCKADKLMCIVSCGGEYPEGSDAKAIIRYLRAVCGMLGIQKVDALWLEGLDIWGQEQRRLEEGLERAGKSGAEW